MKLDQIVIFGLNEMISNCNFCLSEIKVLASWYECMNHIIVSNENWRMMLQFHALWVFHLFPLSRLWDDLFSL